jgi:hypothetical protein
VPIDYDQLMNWKIPEVEQVLTKRDTMLYALGTGLGFDPMDENQLQFVYEKNLAALPSMSIILGYPGPWHRTGNTGIDGSKVVHDVDEGIRMDASIESISGVKLLVEDMPSL